MWLKYTGSASQWLNNDDYNVPCERLSVDKIEYICGNIKLGNAEARDAFCSDYAVKRNKINKMRCIMYWHCNATVLRNNTLQISSLVWRTGLTCGGTLQRMSRGGRRWSRLEPDDTRSDPQTIPNTNKKVPEKFTSTEKSPLGPSKHLTAL